jgi:hypothetical protein
MLSARHKTCWALRGWCNNAAIVAWKGYIMGSNTEQELTHSLCKNKKPLSKHLCTYKKLAGFFYRSRGVSVFNTAIYYPDCVCLSCCATPSKQSSKSNVCPESFSALLAWTYLQSRSPWSWLTCFCWETGGSYVIILSISLSVSLSAVLLFKSKHVSGLS